MVVRSRLNGDGLQSHDLLHRHPCMARPSSHVVFDLCGDYDRAGRTVAPTWPECARYSHEVGKPDAMDQSRPRARMCAHLPVPPAGRVLAVASCCGPAARIATRCAGVEGEPFVTHPRNRLDELIHSPVRLSVMSALRTADQVHFTLLRDTLEVSDSLLSKHVAALDEAGYVEVTKGYVGKKPRTWYSLTERGRHAFDTYVATLREIVGETDVPQGSS